MPKPELPSDWQAIKELQVELERRGVVLPKSMMPLGDTDGTMFRFLRARKMDVTAAADMLANTVEWRTRDNVEQTLETFLPDDKDNTLRRHLPSAFLGFDKSGSPVWMEHAAAVDVPAMEAAGITLEDYVYYHVRAMEYMVNCKYDEASKHAGHPVDNHCVILDLAGLRMNMLNQNTIKVFKSMSSVYQDHYPELMTRMFLVNIPFMFAAVWKVLQIFVDDRVKAKIRFLRKADFHILHEFVDRDILPESLGGKVKGKVLSDKQGFLPPSLVAVNAEVQRRIDAKQSCNQPQQQQQEQESLQQQSVEQQEQQQPPLKQQQQPPAVHPQQPGLAPATPSRFGAEVPASMLSSDSIAPDLVLPPSLVNSSSISSNLSSQGSSPVQRLQLGSRYPAALSDTELVKLGETGSESSQTSYDSAVPVVVLPAHVLETFGPAQPGEQVQGKKSKTQKAKGLLSSFTGGHRKKDKSAQEDMNKALEMLADLRRTESSPNVEAEALKRNKGGGGPWMSFTRQRRPPKPRAAKKGAATPRKNSPLATVTSGDVLQPHATPDAMAFVVQANNHSGADADRHSHSKWKPFCMKAPMVHDDGDVEGHVRQDSRLPKAGLAHPQATPDSLSHRLVSKISAIPAYLKPAEDADSLRLASPEGSNASLTGSSGSYSLQGEVVGRYASAPNLVPLTAETDVGSVKLAGVPPSAGSQSKRRLSADLTSPGDSPSNRSQVPRAVSFTKQPQLGQNGAGPSDTSNRQCTIVFEDVAQSAVEHRGMLQSRRLRHVTRNVTRNWVFLLVCTMNVAAMFVVLSRQATVYQAS